MAAAIVEGDDLTAFASIKNDRLIQDSPFEQLAVHDLMIPAAHVPAVLQEHRSSPVPSGAAGAPVRSPAMDSF
jgi:hypothetical protein